MTIRGVGEQPDEPSVVVGQHRRRGGRRAQPQRDDGGAEGAVQVLDGRGEAGARRGGGHRRVVVRHHQGVDRPVRRGDDVLGARRVVVPHGEQRRGDDAVAGRPGEAEAGGGGAAVLHRHRRVEQQAQLAAVVGLPSAPPVPDADGEREPLQDDRVVDVGGAVALDPHRQPVAGDGRRRGRARVGELPAGRDAQRARRVVLVEPGMAPGQRRGRAEQAAGVDVADDQLVEAGDDAQAQAGLGVERGDPAEELLHVTLLADRCPECSGAGHPARQSARIFSTHASRVRIIPRASTVCGAKMSKAWNPPAQTCSSASPPQAQIRSA